nr:hypothetical protein Iba_chr14aCG24400 [Ipomoea batatas]GMD90823.1 hypothetical protein Iba_chr14dCG13410 [Ipomoea batatas]
MKETWDRKVGLCSSMCICSSLNPRNASMSFPFLVSDNMHTFIALIPFPTHSGFPNPKSISYTGIRQILLVIRNPISSLFLILSIPLFTTFKNSSPKCMGVKVFFFALSIDSCTFPTSEL